MGCTGNIVTGVRVVLVSQQNYMFYCVFSVIEPYSNNVMEYNAILIGMQLVKEIGVKNQHTVIQSSSSAKLVGSMKSYMKTWCPTTSQPLNWYRSLEAFTLTMYHISKMCIQILWCLSLLHWPF